MPAGAIPPLVKHFVVDAEAEDVEAGVGQGNSGGVGGRGIIKAKPNGLWGAPAGGGPPPFGEVRVCAAGPDKPEGVGCGVVTRGLGRGGGGGRPTTWEAFRWWRRGRRCGGGWEPRTRGREDC